MPVHAINTPDGIVATSTSIFSAVNTSPVTMLKGMPARIQTADGTIKRMRATGTYDSVRKIGGLLMDDSVTVGSVGRVQVAGHFQAATAQWDVITGEVGGLVPGALYYMSGEFGMMSRIPPDPLLYVDPWSIAMGTALTATEFVIRIDDPSAVNPTAEFIESVQDVVGPMIAAAGGTYSDAGNSITLPSDGGGGGSIDDALALQAML